MGPKCQSYYPRVSLLGPFVTYEGLLIDPAIILIMSLTQIQDPGPDHNGRPECQPALCHLYRLENQQTQE